MTTLYKHENNTDVAFEILKQFYIRETGKRKLHIRWWNIGKCHEPWCMYLDQKLVLTLEEFSRWNIYNDDPEDDT
jgi:hypothetical protein